MKNFTSSILLLIAFLFTTTNSEAQVLFSENFDNIPGPTNGGAGTYSFPNGWLLANVDNRTPDAGVNFVNDAWERREDFGANVNDSCAFSTSFYSPAGQADDWMWTPAIPLSGVTITLSWKAKAYDPSFADGYEVRIMTVPPVGGTGSIGNMVSASTQIFNIPAENSSWTTRSVDISFESGSTVYIGFRNNSNDKFLLVIDNILVQATNVSAPTFFSEDFDDIPGPTNGGAGSYSFPNGWLLANVDNRTPDAGVNFVNDAWERREDFGTSVDDSCAFSTSFYSPAAQADDWMWTPVIPLTGTNITLRWNAKAYDPAFADGYEVRIMTVPPIGGTGNIGNMVSNSTLLFSTPAENTSWTSRSVDLSAYIGQHVYIGFRNNSNDKFLLVIDDVLVADISVLPVKLVDFWGNHTASGNMLNWKVAEQQDIVGYDIERSIAQSPFTTIGTVTANTQTDYTYQFKDESPLSGVNHYRVKIREATGRVEYSRIIIIQSEGNKLLQLFPNPANDAINVLLSATASGKIISISDIAGRIVKTTAVPAGANISMSVDISMLAKGIYYLRIGDEVMAFVKN